MIYLDEIKREDFDILNLWRKRRVKKKFYKEPLKYDKDVESEWFNNINKSKNCKYWIVRNGNLKIGVIDINNIDFENSSCTIEYIIEDNNFKNRGISEGILQEIHRYIYEELKITNIYCNIKKREEEYINLLLKLGYNVEKIYKTSKFDKNNIISFKYTKKE